jgi:hypothetical protein
MHACMMDDPLLIVGITTEDWAQTPESVRLALLSVFDLMQVQGQQLREFQQVIRDLQAKVGQTSRNSSRPPSSVIVQRVRLEGGGLSGGGLMVAIIRNSSGGSMRGEEALPIAQAYTLAEGVTSTGDGACTAPADRSHRR